MSQRVAVVIAAHTERRWAQLVTAVGLALAQRPAPATVVVVVDHNETLLARVRAELPHARAVPNRYAPGVSGARNSGVEATDTPLVAFLDDDEEPRPGWLDGLVAPFADPAVVGTGGAVEPIWARRQPDWFPDEFGWTVGASYRGLPVTAASVRNVWSGNMAVRRAVFEAVGGFRDGFGKLANRSRPEDTDLCIRMADAVYGGRWMYVPDAVVGHHVPVERTSFGFFVRRSYHEGRGKIEMVRLLQAETGGGGASPRPVERLRSERDYLRRTLPRGVVRGLGQLLRRAEPAGAGRAAAIIAGTIAAGVGVTHAVLSIPSAGLRQHHRRAAADLQAEKAEKTEKTEKRAR